MKKIFSLLFMLVIFITSQSLPTNKYYPSGELWTEYFEGKDGEVLFKDYDKNGSIQIEGIIDPSGVKPIKTIRSYYENGKIGLEIFDKTDKNNIREKHYYESGKLKLIYYYGCNASEKKRCVTSEKFFETGSIKSESESVKKDSISYNIFKDEGVMELNYYKSGVILSINLISFPIEGNAFEKTYFESEKLKSSKKTIMGNNAPLTIEEKSYYEDGKLFSTNEFPFAYDKNKNLISDKKYGGNTDKFFLDYDYNQEAFGIVKEFYKSGKIKKEWTYKFFEYDEGGGGEDFKDGSYKEFSEDGTVTKELIYKKDKVVKTVK